MQNIFESILFQLLSLNKKLTTGSIILRDIDGYYKYIAVKGHDFSILKEVKLTTEDIHENRFHSIRIIRNKIENEKTQQLELLIKGGNLLKLKTYLSIPILINNKNMGFLNIDNYIEENIFTDDIIKLSRNFANFIGTVYSTILKRKKLIAKLLLLEKLNIEKNSLFSKNFLMKKAKELFNISEDFIFITIHYKNALDNKNVLACLIDRLNKLFSDDYISFEYDTFYILTEYISDYYLENEVKKILSQPIFWKYEINPNFEYHLYRIPEDIKDFDELKKMI